MINPAEKLKAKQQEFISIRELIERISRLHPAMSQAQIANWLLIELTDASTSYTAVIDSGRARRDPLTQL